MKVFKFKAIINEREAIEELGTVIAKTAEQANKKLYAHGFSDIHIEELHGLSVIFSRFRADIK